VLLRYRLMKKIIFVLLFFPFIISSIYSNVSGKIVIENTPLPLSGVTILGPNQSTVSNSQGQFEFIVSANSYPIQLLFSANGYTSMDIELDRPTENMVVRMSIARVVTAEQQTVVGAREEKNIAFYKVNEDTLKRLSEQTLFSDLITSVQMLPGVAGNGSFSTELFIRGGSGDEITGGIDNIPIQNPNFAGGRISLFNAKTAASAEFYPGGYDATYGSSLSGVLDVQTLDGDLVEKGGEIDTNLTEVNGYYMTPLTEGTSSVISSYRRTYYDLVASLFIDGSATSFPFVQSFQTKYRRLLSKDTTFTSSLYYFHDGADIDFGELADDETIGALIYDSKRIILSGQMDHVLSSTMFNETLLAGDISFGGFQRTGDSDVDADWNGGALILRNDTTWDYVKDRTLNFGTVLYRYHENTNGRFTITPEDASSDFDAGTVSTTNVTFDSDSLYSVASFYLQDTWLYRFKHEFTTGLRWTISDSEFSSARSLVQPRFSYAYLYSPQTTFKAYTGLYSQEEFVSNTRYVGEAELESFAADLDRSKAVHYGVGVEHYPAQEWVLKGEIFYKKYDDLVVDVGTFPEETYVNDGYGKAEGLEVMLQKVSGSDYQGWLNYTYTQSFRNDSEGWYAPEFDIRHLANMYIDKQIRPGEHLITTIQFQTGKPYTKITGQTFNEDGSVTYERESFNASRLDAYLRIDVWYEWPGVHLLVPIPFLLGGDKRLGWFPVWEFKGKTRVGIFNLLNRQNQLDYFWDEDSEEGSTVVDFPRLPIFGYTFDL